MLNLDQNRKACSQIFTEIQNNIKFHGTASFGSSSVPCVRTDGRVGDTTVQVALFRNCFAQAHVTAVKQIP